MTSTPDRKKVGFLSTNQTGDSGALKSLKDVLIQSGDYMYKLDTCNPNDLYFWRQTPQKKGFFQPQHGSFGIQVSILFFGGGVISSQQMTWLI